MAEHFIDGFPVIGIISETGVYPEQPCAEPELRPRQFLTNADYRIMARMSAVTNPRGGQLWEDALDQVERGRLSGPSPFGVNGKLVTGDGPQLANPAFRFGAQQGPKLIAAGDLKRSQTNRAAAIRAPVNLQTRGHFPAAIRMFQEEQTSKKSLVVAKADHRDA